MAKVVRKKTVKAIKKSYSSPFKIYWTPDNYKLLIAGIVLVIGGFYFMSLGSWDSTSSLFISPLILGIAYFLIFPASIMFKKKKAEKEGESQDASGES